MNGENENLELTDEEVQIILALRDVSKKKALLEVKGIVSQEPSQQPFLLGIEM